MQSYREAGDKTLQRRCLAMSRESDDYERSLQTSENSLNSSDDCSPENLQENPGLSEENGTTEEDITIKRTNTFGEKLLKISTLRDKSLIVPRNERRGLFAQFAFIPEYKDARDYPKGLKLFIVLIIAYAALMGPMATSIIFPAIEPLTEDFNTSTNMVDVSVGIYLLSLGIFPIWWSSLSEIKGRRTVYVLSFILMVGFTIGSALSPNISSFIVFRMLQGASSASVQSVGAGTVSDLFIPEERGKNLGYYYLGVLMAPLISPIVGALLVDRWSWRSTQWFMVILAGINLLCIISFLPETLRTQDSTKAIEAILAERRANVKGGEKPIEDKSEGSCAADDTSTPVDIVGDEEIIVRRIHSQANTLQSHYADERNTIYDVHVPQLSKVRTSDMRMEQSVRDNDLKRVQTILKNELENLNGTEVNQKSGWKKSLIIYFLKPLKSLYFLAYPPVTLAIIFSAISFGILYVVNMTLQHVYSEPPYSFKPLYIGLLYIPNSVTYVIASIYGGRWVDTLLKRYKEKHGIIAPEARIGWNVVVAVITFPMGLLIFGWCLDTHQHWVTPLIGTAIFGFASMMTIGATVSYLVDSLPGRGATGVALNNLIRMILAAVAVFTTTPMLNGLGTGWTYTMLSVLVVLSSGVLFLLKWKGDYYRENFDLQKLYDRLN